MRVLVACERSGKVRDAIRGRGHDAISCDLIPSDRQGPHIIGDALRVAYEQPWDMMIFFWPCTLLCNSGVRWLGNRHSWNDMRRSAESFHKLLHAPIPKIAGENPIPHRYAVEIIGRKYDQIIHPWQFGHGESKSTCLWLEGLPKLTPTNIVAGREQRVWLESPGVKDGMTRGERRGITYDGVADAFAVQWTPDITANHG